MNRDATMSRAVAELAPKDDPLILEVGRTRSSYAAEADGFSTIYFASFLNRRDRGRLISIDVNRDTEVICRAILHSIKQTADKVEFINDEALHVLSERITSSIGLVDLLYLDGLDCDGDEQASAEWHFKCFELAHPLIRPGGGLLLIDDVMDSVEPRGKGKLVVPKALELGYEAVAKDYQWLLRRPI